MKTTAMNQKTYVKTEQTEKVGFFQRYWKNYGESLAECAAGVLMAGGASYVSFVKKRLEK